MSYSPATLAVGADHAVAGDDDRDRVAAVRGAHLARSAPGLDLGAEQGRIDPRRELAVADRRSVGNLKELAPDLLLQGSAMKVDREVEIAALADAARAELVERGVEVSEVQDFPWGRFVFLADPDGNGWAVQEIGSR
jgi:hypothetical protein